MGANQPTDEAFRRFAERSQDVLFRVRFEPGPVVEYVSPSVVRLTGYAPEEFYADPELWTRMLHPDDQAFIGRMYGLPSQTQEEIAAPVRARWIRRDGTTVWTEQRAVPVVSTDGAVTAVEGIARDVTSEVVATEQLRVSEARFHDFLASINLGTLMLDHTGRVIFINAHLLRLLERAEADVLGRDWISAVVPEPERTALREVFLAAIASGSIEAYREDGIVTASGRIRRLAWTSAVLRDAAGAVTGLASVAVDVTEARRIEAERALLAAAVEQAAESILVTDVTGRIEYANSSFERITGYPRAEAIGATPRILKSGHQSATFYDAMWAALSNGLSWTAEFTNRRRDGGLYRESTVISPVRATDGPITNYVSVARDVTRERELETQEEAMARERALIADTLSRLEPGDTLESTAAMFCRQVRSLTNISVASILGFGSGGDSLPLALVSADGVDAALRPIPAGRAAYLRDRAAAGPWVEAWEAPEGHPFGPRFAELGVTAFAYAPIWVGPTLVGALAIGSSESDGVAHLAPHLAAITDFAALAAALIGPSLRSRNEAAAGRGKLEAVIAEREFRPVFQPIVDIRRGQVVGHEALTRFPDGARPDQRFTDAKVLGLGLELEVATLEAAVAAAEGLPQGRWVSLNVSPDLITDSQELRRILADRPRRAILEVTEHVPIADYAAFATAIGAIGRSVLLAVDDAGAGFSSLRHILELRPAFVKLDVSLVRGIDGDRAKQALVAGMKHFAESTRCRLIAEGVETPAEAEALDRLDVRLAQGYLFGRPSAADELGRPQTGPSAPPE